MHERPPFWHLAADLTPNVVACGLRYYVCKPWPLSMPTATRFRIRHQCLRTSYVVGKTPCCPRRRAWPRVLYPFLLPRLELWRSCLIYCLSAKGLCWRTAPGAEGLFSSGFQIFRGPSAFLSSDLGVGLELSSTCMIISSTDLNQLSISKRKHGQRRYAWRVDTYGRSQSV